MKIYNTMTRKKEEFVPNDPKEVKIYACGPTVYNYIHIGNARPLCVFDVLRRYLEYRGYNVKFVQNFTDVDDKIIKRANEEGSTFEEISKKYIEEFWTDANGLNFKKATVHPKATENIDEIINIIKTLEEKGYAYSVDGDVYFRTLKFKDYGKLSISLLRIYSRAQELLSVRKRKILLISLFGKLQKRVSLIGSRLGVRADRAGILNALL